MTRAVSLRIVPIVAVCAAGLLGAGAARAAQPPAPDEASGRRAYGQHCARCHGDAGAGDGRDARRLYPRPRDLTAGVFKFRTTASNTAPTDEDLFKTLDHGLTAGGMPDWSHLDTDVRWQLVYYLKTFSTAFKDAPPELVDLGKDPGPKAVDLAAGKKVYEELGCAACHGAAGRGHGTSAPTLEDNWGPTRPADLTKGWSYRGGSDARAIVARILTGIDGTPMPSYAEAVSKEKAWQLAYYVQSLQEPARWSPMLHAVRVPGELPDAPDDPRWSAAERVDVRLRNAVNAAGEIAGPLSVSSVSMRALYNEGAIAFLLAWHDATQDTEQADALAIALRPVDVDGDVVSLQAWPLRDSPALDLCVWSSLRPASGPVGQAHEMLTARYEPALDRTPRGIPLQSRAVYVDGEWRLVIIRPLDSQRLANRSAQFSEHRYTPVGLAVWDGGNPGQRAVSAWIDVMLGKPVERHGAHEPAVPKHQEPPRSAPQPPQPEEPPPAEPPQPEAKRPSRPGAGMLAASGAVLVAALALALQR